MKKFIFLVLMFIFILCVSCSDDELGIDIGETTVSVSLKESEEAPPDIMYAARDMFIVFDSLTRAMEYYDIPYSDSDSEFMWRTLSVLLNNCGEGEPVGDGIRATAELIGDYMPACFNGKTKIPQITDYIEYNPESMIYKIPIVSDYSYDDYTVEVGDILDNGDRTYTAYINYVDNIDGSIAEQYIFTLIDNPYAEKNDESSNIMLYSVIGAALLIM